MPVRQSAAKLEVTIPTNGHDRAFKLLRASIEELKFKNLQIVSASDRNTEMRRFFDIIPVSGKGEVSSYEEFRISGIVDELNRKAMKEARKNRSHIGKIRLNAIEIVDDEGVHLDCLAPEARSVSALDLDFDYAAVMM